MVLNRALAIGALPALTALHLQSNEIGNDGISVIASACNAFILHELKELVLYGNRIGDAGVGALATSCGHSDALPYLEVLNLNSNLISDLGMMAITQACVEHGALARLRGLGLYNNLIGDSGALAFAYALMHGALPVLEDFTREGNSIGIEGKSTLLKSIASMACLQSPWLHWWLDAETNANGQLPDGCGSDSSNKCRWGWVPTGLS